jgi:hypothetical protein
MCAWLIFIISIHLLLSACPLFGQPLLTVNELLPRILELDINFFLQCLIISACPRAASRAFLPSITYKVPGKTYNQMNQTALDYYHLALKFYKDDSTTSRRSASSQLFLTEASQYSLAFYK